MEIKKSTGETQEFSEEKIFKTSKRAGASDELASETVEEVKKKLEEGMTTDTIYENVLTCLANKDSAVAARYSLKKSIMKLGPSGFIFEKYIAAILREHGYETQTGIIMKGKCVTHEVDVFAKKGKRHIHAECKYHNHRGIRTGVKVSMYVHARSQDIIDYITKVETEEGVKHEGWLITNTQCSYDAITFAECRDLNILSWNYPREKSLRDIIEEKSLYPVTIIRKIPKKVLNNLSQANVLFAHELTHMSTEKLMEISDMKKNEAQSIQQEVASICRIEE